MNAMPPSVASATAIRSPDTACMMAETIGMFRLIAGFSPAALLYLTSGVLRLTFAGRQSFPE